MTENRPVYLNLFKIRLPVTGVVSFAHRVSGILLFLCIPYAVYLLGLSVASETDFSRVVQLQDRPWMLWLEVLLLWSLLHHLLAGIRYLLIDAEIGIELKQARFGAWVVLLVESILLLAVVWVLVS